MGQTPSHLLYTKHKYPNRYTGFNKNMTSNSLYNTRRGIVNPPPSLHITHPYLSSVKPNSLSFDLYIF